MGMGQRKNMSPQHESNLNLNNNDKINQYV